MKKKFLLIILLLQNGYHNHDTRKNQLKLVWKHFDLSLISNYNTVTEKNGNRHVSKFFTHKFLFQRHYDPLLLRPPVGWILEINKKLRYTIQKHVFQRYFFVVSKWGKGRIFHFHGLDDSYTLFSTVWVPMSTHLPPYHANLWQVCYSPETHPKTATCIHGRPWNEIGWNLTYWTRFVALMSLKTTEVGFVLPGNAWNQSRK